MKLVQKLGIATASLAVSVATVGIKSASAASISWADWTSVIQGIPDAAQGTITLPNQSPVSVTYNGEITFAQISGGTNYWEPSAPYISQTVPNAPPASDIIAITGGNNNVNTITFSTPVVNPVLAIVSLGQFGVPVNYEFNSSFNILSVGGGFFGNGTLTQLPNNVLQGREGHGVIQFTGTVSSISWTAPNPEFWHGFTVGTAEVPEPLTLGGSMIAISFGWMMKRKKKNSSENA